MLDPKKRDGYDAADQKFLKIIDDFGWHVMSVAPRVNSDDEQEWFSYSTGLYRAFGHPEILLMGLNSELAIGLINDIGSEVKLGRKFKQKTQCGEIFGGGVKCQFRAVLPDNYGDYVLFSEWFYENSDFPVWQCFWPDKAGKYPWQKDCSRRVAKLQRLLYLPQK